MADTYTQIHLHFVFAVKYRRALIHPLWKQELHKYITGIFQQNNHKMLQINSMPDHIHILVGFRPNQAISQMIQNVKTESSKWINHRAYCDHKFNWQGGFSAFSCSKSQVKRVIKYIENQERHHQNISFTKEHRMMLDANNVEYDERYLFHEPV